MKNACFFIPLLMVAIFSSCTKNSDTPDTAPTTPVSMTWKEKLKNTVWAGEYKYTVGNLQSLQPFSLLLNADGTAIWEDLENRRSAGSWIVTADQIMFTFPNGTTLSATVANDQWSDIKSGAGAGFVIVNIARSAAPIASELANTKWSGLARGLPFELKFLNNGNMVYTNSGSVFYSGTYTIGLAGIQFSGGGISFYGIFKNANTELTGLNHNIIPSIHVDDYLFLDAKKQ